jgi:FKBP-type peptidyl-prolyl cis-trans isomerase (trigger factor)
MEMEKYLEHLKKTKDDLKKEWQPQAEKRVKSALALEELVKEKEIEISSEKIEEEMNKTLQYYGGKEEAKDKIDMTRLYNHTKKILQNEEIFEMLEKM